MNALSLDSQDPKAVQQFESWMTQVYRRAGLSEFMMPGTTFCRKGPFQPARIKIQIKGFTRVLNQEGLCLCLRIPEPIVEVLEHVTRRLAGPNVTVVRQDVWLDTVHTTKAPSAIQDATVEPFYNPKDETLQLVLTDLDTKTSFPSTRDCSFLSCVSANF